MHTLVDGVTYLVAGANADVNGFYHGDTRHLSSLDVSVDGVSLTPVDERRRRPSRRTRRFADLGPPVNEISGTNKHAGVVLERRQTVTEGRFVERLSLGNHGGRRRPFDVAVTFDADFADVFEVRGVQERGTREVTATVDDAVEYAYSYLDGAGETRTVETVVEFDRDPATLEAGRATFAPTLDPEERWRVGIEVIPGGDESTVRARRPEPTDFAGPTGSAAPQGPARSTDHTRRPGSPDRVDPFDAREPIETGNAAYDRTFAQARRDVRALTTTTEYGPVPLAGAPWFVTMFGRDALLASYLLLPVAPALARGTLRYLAAHQGTRSDDGRDERAGKVLHEVRRGELARTGAIPQTPYYGSVDATPLWIALLQETWRWTGDDALVRDLWPNLAAALDWLDREVARVGDDPFLYYGDLGSGGVVHKVWRDSTDGVQHADGTMAGPPLACAAVQGYVYGALSRAAALASAVGDDRADALADRADRFADAFHEAFWLPETEFYATALTPDGGTVDSVTSDPGHCLWSGIVPPDVVDRVADRLLAPDVFSGWGIRTLSADHDGYSPVSYHAGGVWPHDNALAAIGLAENGRRDAAARVAFAQLDAFSHFGDHSVPELFCGFDDGSPPAPYPSACRPQAWAAAAPFGFLRALSDVAPDDVRGIGDAISPERVGDLVERWR